MAVVVTGSEGFVGSALVTELAARGRQVVGIDRRPVRQDASERRDHLVLTGDLLHRDAARRRGPGHRRGGRPPRRLSGGARRLDRRRAPPAPGQRAGHRPRPRRGPRPRAGRRRLVVVGLRRQPRRGPAAEGDPLAPRGGYAASKTAVEALCARRAAAGGRVIVARPFTVVGEGQRPDMALARWLAARPAGRPLRVYGSPERTRDLTDVRDVARVLVDLAEPIDPWPVLNLGTGAAAHAGAMVAAAVGRRARRPAAPRSWPAADVELADTLGRHPLAGVGRRVRAAHRPGRRSSPGRRRARTSCPRRRRSATWRAGRRVALVVAALAVAGGGRARHRRPLDVRRPRGGRRAAVPAHRAVLCEDGDLTSPTSSPHERWRDFHDAELPVQTEVLADGRQVSPHDPLLPLLLAVPMGAGRLGRRPSSPWLCWPAGSPR